MLHINYYRVLILFHHRTACVGAPVLRVLYSLRKRVCAAIASETSSERETFMCQLWYSQNDLKWHFLILIPNISAICYCIHQKGVWSGHLGVHTTSTLDPQMDGTEYRNGRNKSYEIPPQIQGPFLEPKGCMW